MVADLLPAAGRMTWYRGPPYFEKRARTVLRRGTRAGEVQVAIVISLSRGRGRGVASARRRTTQTIKELRCIGRRSGLVITCAPPCRGFRPQRGCRRGLRGQSTRPTRQEEATARRPRCIYAYGHSSSSWSPAATRGLPVWRASRIMTPSLACQRACAIKMGGQPAFCLPTFVTFPGGRPEAARTTGRPAARRPSSQPGAAGSMVGGVGGGWQHGGRAGVRLAGCVSG